MKYILSFLLYFLFVGNSFAVSLTTQTFDCGIDNAGKELELNLTLTNEGGSNVFYLSTDLEEKVLYIYGNQESKPVKLIGTANATGGVRVDVSCNYSPAMTLSMVDYRDNFSPQNSLKFLIGVLCGIVILVIFSKILAGGI